MSALTISNLALAVAIGVFLGTVGLICLIASLLIGWYLFEEWQRKHHLSRATRRYLREQRELLHEQEGY